MPKTSTLRVPSYRRHKPTNQAVVTINGQDIYLGKWNTGASKAEYDRLIAEFLANGRRLPDSNDRTVVELLAAYTRFARSYYVKNGKPTRQYGLIVETARSVKRLYGRHLAKDFGPLALQSIQGQMIQADLSRRTINDHVARIKRMFKWAVAQELIPATSLHALQYPLKCQHCIY